MRLDPNGGRPGAGLGLAIARGIARQHGGDLRCDSVERGASFTLVLPAAGGLTAFHRRRQERVAAS